METQSAAQRVEVVRPKGTAKNLSKEALEKCSTTFIKQSFFVVYDERNKGPHENIIYTVSLGFERLSGEYYFIVARFVVLDGTRVKTECHCGLTV
uniref:Uncharacterized protein n=1 Tax=Glossina palpalis gambiensis TaxID=67801 RepID=A0A1B0BK29_9MUSC